MTRFICCGKFKKKRADSPSSEFILSDPCHLNMYALGTVGAVTLCSLYSKYKQYPIDRTAVIEARGFEPPESHSRTATSDINFGHNVPIEFLDCWATNAEYWRFER